MKTYLIPFTKEAKEHLLQAYKILKPLNDYNLSCDACTHVNLALRIIEEFIEENQ